MCESTEQRICNNFCFKIGKPATETYQLLQQAYGTDAMGLTQVFDWFHRFKEGRTSAESDPRSGRPSTSRNEDIIAKVRTIILNNRRLTVLEIADDCGISVDSCDAILTDVLNMCAKFVPRLLTDDQHKQRQTLARDLFERSCEDVQFLKNIVTGDESWVYGYDPETSSRHSRRVPRLRDQRKGTRCEAKQRSCYWSFLILKVSYTTSTLPTGKQLTRNSTWRSCDVCVNQFTENNQKNGGMATGPCTKTMRPHTSHLVQKFLAKHGTAQLRQSPYSPDLAPCDFFLFPRLKKILKGHRFEAKEDIKRNSTKTPLDIPKEEFAKCFQQWQQRWAKRVAAEGNCVEDN